MRFALPSSELRRVLHLPCYHIGEVGNAEHPTFDRQSRSRSLGRRTPHGPWYCVMNPVDHPHGGGEGKNHTSGRPSVTPWGVSRPRVIRPRSEEGFQPSDYPSS